MEFRDNLMVNLRDKRSGYLMKIVYEIVCNKTYLYIYRFVCVCVIWSGVTLTTRTRMELMKKRIYPVKFRLRVLSFASLYANIASVPTANGWYTRESTLDGWYLCIINNQKQKTKNKTKQKEEEEEDEEFVESTSNAIQLYNTKNNKKTL